MCGRGGYILPCKKKLREKKLSISGKSLLATVNPNHIEVTNVLYFGEGGYSFLNPEGNNHLKNRGVGAIFRM